MIDLLQSLCNSYSAKSSIHEIMMILLCVNVEMQLHQVLVKNGVLSSYNAQDERTQKKVYLYILIVNKFGFSSLDCYRGDCGLSLDNMWDAQKGPIQYNVSFWEMYIVKVVASLCRWCGGSRRKVPTTSITLWFRTVLPPVRGWRNCNTRKSSRPGRWQMMYLLLPPPVGYVF